MKHYDDQGLIDLINKSQSEPINYTSLLIDQIFPTLEKISNKLTSDSVIHNINGATSQYINDIHTKYSTEKDIENRPFVFFKHLAEVIKCILLDKSNHRSHSIHGGYRKNVDFLNDLSEIHGINYSIHAVDKALDLSKAIDMNAYTALTLKLYTASSNAHIASLMNKSTATVDTYIGEGARILVALMRNPEIIVRPTS